MEAERQAAVSPTAAAFFAGKAVEVAVKWAFRSDPDLKLPYQDNISALLHEPSFRRAAGDAVFAKARYINTLRNRAVHEEKTISPGDAAGAVKELFHVCFSNRPFGVKHFQTVHQCGVDVARGLVLLSGIGTWALPSWDPRTRRNNLWDDLAVSVTAGSSRHTNSPHPSSRKGHLSTARWSSSFPPIDPAWRSCCCRFPGPPELGAVNPDAVQDHGQPASQSHDRLFHPTAPGDLHGPRLEPGPFF